MIQDHQISSIWKSTPTTTDQYLGFTNFSLIVISGILKTPYSSQRFSSRTQAASRLVLLPSNRPKSSINQQLVPLDLGLCILTLLGIDSSTQGWRYHAPLVKNPPFGDAKWSHFGPNILLTCPSTARHDTRWRQDGAKMAKTPTTCRTWP